MAGMVSTASFGAGRRRAEGGAVAESGQGPEAEPGGGAGFGIPQKEAFGWLPLVVVELAESVCP